MEIVSNKLSLTAASTTAASPPVSVRRLDSKETFSSSQRRWNGGIYSQRSSHGRRESLAGSSLMSLKAYYRKLRTFKGTIKALISFRRMPTFAARTGSVSAVPTLTQHAEEVGSGAVVEGAASKVSDAVAKLADGESALHIVQSQVKELVDKGHVVTELDPADKDDVTYRLQGNLEHYTEENLRKRIKLQEHPHMVALTQRLWLAANHEEETQLSFGEYEAYMLRLHRLILPEFVLAQSKELIKDDWVRDTDGSDHLDYRFFHFSMFELVDLWTDTVDAEDYISLLYCIMHSLTFTWNDRHILKDLNDVNPVDILEASKLLTMEEIEHDLAQEVNSESAQMYRDRIAREDEEDQESGKPDVALDQEDPLKPASRTAGTDTAKAVAGEKGSGSPKAQLRHKPSGSNHSGATADKRAVVARTASSPSKAPNDRRKSAREGARLAPRMSTMGGGQALSEGDELLAGEAELPVSQDHDGNDPSSSLAGRMSPRLLPDRMATGSGPQPGGTMSEFNIQGRQQGNGYGARAGSIQTGPRMIYSSGAGNQYGTGPDGSNSPISITSLGAGNEFINLVSKPGFARKPSTMGVSASSRQGDQSEGGIGHAVFGLGLQAGQSAVAAGFAHHIVQAGDHLATPAYTNGGSFPTPRSMSTSPRAPHPPRQSGKESEARQGSLVVGEQLRSPPIVYSAYGNSSPRARSAKSQARISSPAGPQLAVSTMLPGGGGDTIGVAGASGAPVSALSIDMGDEHSTLIARMQGNRQSILSRPATSSPYRNSSPNQSGALSDYLQTRAYQESALKLGRPLSRASRVYQQRVSQSLVQDLAVTTLGAQGPFSSRLSTQARPATAQLASVNHRTFPGSIVGSSKLSFESPPMRFLNQRASMAVGKTSRIPATPRKATGGELRLGLSLGISASPAKLELHTQSLSARKAGP